MDDIYTSDLSWNIEQLLHKLDLMAHPYLLVCNPEDEKELTKHNTNEEYIIECSSFVEKGKCLLIDRRKVDTWNKEETER